MNVYPDKEMLENSEMKVVDIRTPMEWQQTGIVPGSHTIMFFDQMGNYDADTFLKEIEALGGKEAEIGLLCRTGARTSQVTSFLEQQGYNVKNLAGGIMKLMGEGYTLEDYKA